MFKSKDVKDIDVKSLKKKRWFYLLLQIIIGMATSFTFSLSVYIGPLNEVKGWGIQEILLTFTVSMWVGPIATIVGGKARDTWGNKACIIVAGILYGLSVMVSGLVGSVVLFIIIQGCVTAFCMYAVFLAQQMQVSKLFPEMRATALGILNGGLNLCSAALPIIAVGLMGLTSVVGSIMIQGLAFSVICLVCGLLIFDPPEGFQMVEEQGGDEDGEFGPPAAFNLNWRYVLRQPAFYIIEVFLILISLMGSMIQANLSLMTQDATGVGEVKAAWVVTVSVVVLGIGGIIVGFLADKFGTYKVLVLIAGGTAASLLIGALLGVQHFYVFFLAIMIVAFLFGGLTSLLPVVCMDAFGDRFFGVNMGLIGVANLVSTLVGPQMSAILPVPPCFIISGAAAALGIVFILAASKSVDKMHKNEKLYALFADEEEPAEIEEPQQ